MSLGSKIIKGVLIGSLFLCGVSVASEGISRDEAYQAIRDHQVNRESWSKSLEEIMSSGKSPEEMKVEAEKLGPYPDPTKLLDEAELVIHEDSSDDKAFVALGHIRLVSGILVAMGQESAREKSSDALSLLLNHHVERPDVLSAIGDLIGSAAESIEACDKIYELNSHESVKAEVTLTKVRMLSKEIAKATSAEEREKLFSELELGVEILSKNYPEAKGYDDAFNVEYSYMDVANSAYEASKSLLHGEVFEDFDVATLDGEPDRVSNYRGQFVLLDYWATWCGPCLVAIPELTALKNELKDYPFEIISISLDEDVQAVIDFHNEKTEMPWVNWHLDPTEVDMEVGGMKIPHYILLNPDGQVVFRTTEFNDEKKAYTKNKIKALIAESQGS
ncbi:MAG: TlpA family protein disulfide reductase [Gammaproteobacteria bacterium]|nr:TlpA family protein disulfide reductase [Gammaproteobacteria bacterium]MYL01425.1 TlpA family protein disulfide reductase [Gammaproteobacteria bacterium]